MKVSKVLVVLICGLFIFAACCKKQVVKKEEPTPPAKQEKVAEKPVVKPVVKPAEVKKDTLTSSYKVKKGECLWKISSYKDIYSDPFMWPLIYKANKKIIKDPDLIFPNQVLAINRSFSPNDKAAAVKFAKTRGKWSLTDGK